RELGHIYLFGNPKPENLANGLAWIERAAGNGDARAAYIMGVLLFAGDKVPPDPVRAYAWTRLALEAGLSEAAPSEAAMRRALENAEADAAYLLARTLVTGAPNAAPFGLLVGEQAVLTLAAAAPAEDAGIEESPLVALTEEPAAEIQVVGSAEVLATSPGESAVEIRQPETGTETETGTMSEAEEKPRRDLGDPESPLVDAEEFTGSWSVQLASFRTPEKAEAEWNDLRRRHPGVLGNVTRKILRFDPGGELGVRYRLRAGPFAARAEAEAVCAALAESKSPCLVIGPGTR
ncbi:MAG TPA: SPOR domain-containing protein, partial [Sphingomonadales bacterium]|nr:SPOR domain-containing protein [Sphingomonadales bacterium]